MIYFLLVLILVIYIFFLFINKDKQNYPKLLIIVTILLTISITYLFSLNYQQSNVDIYKEIYNKNVQVRNNIKTIKDNLPKLEEKLVSNPNNFNGWLMLGKSYSILKDYHKASKAYEVAINLRQIIQMCYVNTFLFYEVTVKHRIKIQLRNILSDTSNKQMILKHY